MIRFPTIGLTILGFFVLIPTTPSQAEQTTYEFSGVLTQVVQDPVGLAAQWGAVGDPFSGMLSYDPDYWNAAAGTTFLGRETYLYQSYLNADPAAAIVLSLTTPLQSREIPGTPRESFMAVSNGPDEVVVAGEYAHGFALALTLQDATGAALTNTTMPGQLTATPWSSQYVEVTGIPHGGYVRGEVTTLHRVPEPSSWMLLGAALLGLVWLQRCRTSTRQRGMIVGAVIVIFVGAPLMVQAAQITPNPNPDGSTIAIINDPFAQNAATPFANAGTIIIEASSTLTNTGILTNTGLLRLEVARGQLGTLTNNGLLINATGGRLEGPGMLTNNGLLINDTGSTLQTSHGHMTNAGTLINNSFMLSGQELSSTGTLINNVGGTFTVGDFLGSSGILTNYGLMTVTSSLFNNAGGTFTNVGTLYTPSIHNSGTLTNSGTFSSSHLDNNAGASLTNTGTLMSNGLLNNSAGALLTNAGTLTTTTDTSSKNDGTLLNAGILTNDGLLDGSGTYIQTSGQTLNNGSLTQSSIIINGGTFGGTGTITGDMTIGSGATISPGNSPGTLTINGNVASSGNLLFQIGGLASGLYDVLRINGNALFTGGNITFDFIDGFLASARDSWNFLYASTITGWDTLTFTVNGLSPNQTYAFNYANGVETLTVREVHKVPEPSSLLLLAVGLAGLEWWRRKRAA